MSAREVAGRLTKAQREATIEFPNNGSGLGWFQSSRIVRKHIEAKGLIERVPCAPNYVGMVRYRLTPLGLEVRRVLESE